MIKAILTANKTRRVPEEALLQVPAPAFTDTWRPYSHREVIEALRAGCDELGFKVTRKEYSANRSLSRMFGVWEIENYSCRNYNLAIGIRGSLDKHFAIGLCAGERVFVCDNLAFSSDFVLFRRHTLTLTVLELQVMATEALRAMLGRFQGFRAWKESLKNWKLEASQAGLLTIAAMRQGLVPVCRFNEFFEIFFSSTSKYEHSLFGFHGAVAELHRDSNLLTLQGHNDALNLFLRHEAIFYTRGGGEWNVDAAREEAGFTAEAVLREQAEGRALEQKALRRQIDWRIKEGKKAPAGSVER